MRKEMKVLLSIKPEYADKIFAGTKKYEFRRSIFKNQNIKTIVVYSSSPVQKVIGEFEIESILQSNISELWDMTAQESGINKEFFFEYYKGKDRGFAIKIKNIKKYDKPLDIKADFKLTPPQSFVYIQS